jgi:adenosylcobinamide-phosphate synthase
MLMSDGTLEYVFIVLIALAFDLAFGELPNRLHPVAGLGRIISWELKLAPKGKLGQLGYGTFIVLATVALLAVPVYLCLAYLRDVNTLLFVLVGAVILKFTFSLRELDRAAMRVKVPLEADDLPEARRQVGMIVSRRTGDLEEASVVSATVESLGESIVDSFVSPLFYFLLLGIPGAVAYRVCNTFDSMIGYRGEYEYLGKFAARLDDILNSLPARLAGLAIVVGAWFSRRSAGQAWRVMWRDHGKTESPNAGWTMAATAGALGVELEKGGHYRLGDALVPLSADTILQAARMMWVSAAVWSLLCIAIIGGIGVLTS